MKKIILSLLVIPTLLFAQGTSGTNAKFEYRRIVDMQTAGVLETGFVGVSVDVLPFGSVVSKIEVGVFESFSFGISYGGANIIGTGDIGWYELPGINVRLRIVDETLTIPAFTLGFDTQGKGAYDEGLNRYEIKSPGFFVAASKNFEFLGYLSLHGMLNFTLERQDGDKDFNIAVGFEKTIGSRISFIGEFDFAMNDNADRSVGKGNGYLNMGLRFSVGSGFTIGLDFRNLLENKKFTTNKADRGLFIDYVKAVF